MCDTRHKRDLVLSPLESALRRCPVNQSINYALRTIFTGKVTVPMSFYPVSYYILLPALEPDLVLPASMFFLFLADYFNVQSPVIVPDTVFLLRYKEPALALSGIFLYYIVKFMNSAYYFNVQVPLIVPDTGSLSRYKGLSLALSEILSLLFSYYSVKFMNSAYYFNVQVPLNASDPAFLFRYKGPALRLCGMLSLFSLLFSYYSVKLINSAF